MPKPKKLGTAPTTKYKLVRDGQIVGYKRTIAGVTEYSYQNETWVPTLSVPYDEAKAFISYDSTNLVEVYED
jgi:hypothetical protein